MIKQRLDIQEAFETDATIGFELIVKEDKLSRKEAVQMLAEAALVIHKMKAYIEELI